MGRDYQIRESAATAAREIKATAHYAYIVNGVTLDGSAFATDELVLEGQTLVKETATGKYVKYPGNEAGAFPAGYTDPVILDESVQFRNIEGVNPDVTVGQVLVHGAVYAGMCIGLDTAFEEKLAGAIRFVRN